MVEVLIAVLGLSALIVIHEAGHFLAARALGMRVTNFSIGVGPAIASYRRPGAHTRYELRAIPFAAYVRIAGMVRDDPEVEDPDDPALYHRKGILSRALVNAAGPIANYAAASLMIFGLAVTAWPSAVPSASDPAKVTTIHRQLPLGEALHKAAVLPAKHTVLQLGALASMVASGDTGGLTGPVGMGKLVADQAHKGAVELVSVLILMSIGLGLFNLLPFPGLDGGKLAFLAYEAITRKRPNARVEVYAHAAGLLFLLGVVALVTVRDVMG